MTGIRLQPVVEFDPFEYRIDRPAPSQPIERDPEGWAEFWRLSLADAGICDLTPLPNTWVVPVDQIQDSVLLATVVMRHFDETDADAFLATLPGPFDSKSGMNADGESIEEHFTALRGGLSLVAGESNRDTVGDNISDNDHISITPECCGDLSNWNDWLNATRVETEAWQDLWIGHPSARVCRSGEFLHVQKVLESGDEAGRPIAVRPQTLLAAAEGAKVELRSLAARLVPILQSAAIEPPLAERMARKLAGLAEFDRD